MRPDASALQLFLEAKKDGWPGIQGWLAQKEPESDILEFKPKARPVGTFLDQDDKETLARALSGFANVGGGVLGFGFYTKKRKGGPDRLDNVRAFADLDAFKHQVECAHPLVTDPAIPGVKVEAIEDPGQKGAGVLLVYVPQSYGGPHRVARTQTGSDDRYFMRTSARTAIMPHSVLAAMFGRSAPSRLRLRIIVIGMFHTTEGTYVLDVRLINDGRGSARQPAIRLVETHEPRPTLWHEAFEHSPIDKGWTRTYLPDDEHTALTLRSDPSVLLYPGDQVKVARIKLGTIDGRSIHLADVRQIRIAGTLYAADEQPTDFDHILTRDFLNAGPPGKPPEVIIPRDD